MTGTSSPVVTVLVVTHASAALLPDFARSLPEGLGGLPHELVVVDSASCDDTLTVVDAWFPEATVVALRHNLGYAAGVNAGLAARTGDGPVLVCNPDLRLAPGFVPAMLEAAAEPAVGVVAPRLTDEQGNLQWSLRRDPTIRRVLGEAVLGGTRAGRHPGWGEVVTDPDRYRSPTDVDWASGACLLITAACAADVGPWDESFFLYSEETDFCLRARDRGWRVRYTPAAVAVHLGGESQESRVLFSLLTANRLRLYRKRHGRLASAAFAAALTFGTGIRALAGRPQHRAALGALVPRPGRRRLPEPVR